MIRMDSQFPRKSAASDVDPAVHVADGQLFLAYRLPDDELSALVRFDGVCDWS